MCASRAGSWVDVQALVAAGEDVEAQDVYGCTALIYASNHGHSAVVQGLAAAGADLEA